ncbi:MAG: chemotaxis protein CheC [Spirochaetia bacterium]|nr:chemotaxis protein CheC [Spirochaetia bacterium]
MFKLSEIQEDALKEAINISIGKAAASLNQMIKEEIFLSVPRVKFAKEKDALGELKLGPEKELSYVSQKFKGTYLDTEAMLLFAETDSLELVKLFLGQHINIEEMSSLEHEAVAEIGNIILNSCMASLANILHDEISGTIPEFVACKAKNIFKMGEKETVEQEILIIFIDFNIKTKEIQGYVILVLDLDSIEVFLNRLLKNLT